MTIQQEADKQYRKTDDKKYQRQADGIDELSQLINQIYEQAKIDRL